MKGRIGYEIFPDRFRSSASKEGTLNWDKPIDYDEKGGHQYDFYGGDLKGITSKIDYIKSLNIDFIYLTPIFSAKTNHRYDATDFFRIDKMLGNETDFKELTETAHKKDIRIVMDAVFNHISIKHPWYEQKEEFILHKNGKASHWANSTNLPELNLENPELRKILWDSKDSVIDKWTALGADDWRFDCAYELGFDYMREITEHLKAMGDHETYGEIWSYPKEWISNGVMTGIMNYYYKELTDMLIDGEINNKLFMDSIEKCIEDCGVEKLIKSWNILSSHDTERIRHRYGDKWKSALCLQFTLPGSPLIYYGEEIGLVAGNDPHCRQPMPWNILDENNDDLAFFRKLTELYSNTVSLNSGNFERLRTNNENILAFSRYTDSIDDYVVVAINTSDEIQKFSLITTESKLMNHGVLKDEFSMNILKSDKSILRGTMDANSFGIYKIERNWGNYSPYKRIK